MNPGHMTEDTTQHAGAITESHSLTKISYAGNAKRKAKFQSLQSLTTSRHYLPIYQIGTSGNQQIINHFVNRAIQRKLERIINKQINK